MPYQEITWRDRMVVGSGQVRDGLNITVDTVPLLHNSGLLLAISEGVNAAQRAAYEQEQVTKMLASRHLLGALRPSLGRRQRAGRLRRYLLHRAW